MSVERGSADGSEAYDLIVLGDQVVVGWQVVSAAIAVKGERIAGLLDLEEGRQPGVAARTIDARGKVVLPGPIDAHGDTMATGGDLGLTQTGAILGTPLYMAPELGMGSRDPKPAVDIWAFGVMAYELLTGSMPFAEAPVLARLAGRIASPPRTLEIEIDDALKAIIARCLSSDHEDRPTASELVAAFAIATPGS